VGEFSVTTVASPCRPGIAKTGHFAACTRKEKAGARGAPAEGVHGLKNKPCGTVQGQACDGVSVLRQRHAVIKGL